MRYITSKQGAYKPQKYYNIKRNIHTHLTKEEIYEKNEKPDF